MDDVLIALQALIDAAVNPDPLKKVYTVFYGDVEVPSDTIFPLIEIDPKTTRFNRIGTGGLSQNEYDIEINYKNTIKKFVDKNNASSATILKHKRDAVKVMEERSATTAQPIPTSVLGAIHADLTLSGKVQISRDFEINYDVDKEAGSWVVTASLTFTAEQKTPINC